MRTIESLLLNKAPEDEEEILSLKEASEVLELENVCEDSVEVRLEEPPSPSPTKTTVVKEYSAPDKRVVLVDGSNLAMRCYYSMRNMSRSDGKPTGLLYGILKSLRSIQRECSAKAILVWDRGGSKKKREIYSGYKAHRKKSDSKSECFEQLEEVKTLLNPLGIPQAYLQDEEADDVISSLACSVMKDHFVFVYSSDDDFLQLVDDSRLIVVKATKTGLEFYDSEKVEERLGVLPPKVVFYRSLRGDKSDGLPGAARVPSKVLVPLVNAYDSLEDLYSDEGAFEECTKNQKEKLLAHKEQAFINRELMDLDRSLSPDIEVPEFCINGVERLFEDMEFASMLENLEEWESSFGPSSGFMKTS